MPRPNYVPRTRFTRAWTHASECFIQSCHSSLESYTSAFHTDLVQVFQHSEGQNVLSTLLLVPFDIWSPSHWRNRCLLSWKRTPSISMPRLNRNTPLCSLSSRLRADRPLNITSKQKRRVRA